MSYAKAWSEGRIARFSFPLHRHCALLRGDGDGLVIERFQALLSKVLVIETSICHNPLETVYLACSPMFDRTDPREQFHSDLPKLELQRTPTGLGVGRDDWEFEFVAQGQALKFAVLEDRGGL